MTVEWKELQEYTNYLKRLHSARHDMMNDLEDIYLMSWDDEERIKKTQDNIKITKSPDARNSIIGALRLLVATDPIFSTRSGDENIVDTSDLDKLEIAAGEMWRRSGAIRGDPVHYDVVLSMLLFGEAVTSVTRTADMIAYSKNAPKAYRYQVEQIAKATPYLFDVLDPRTCYPDSGAFGLNALYRESTTTYQAVQSEYPKFDRQMKASRFGSVVVCDYWDMELHRTWVRGDSKPLVEETHGLDFIPFVVVSGEGSKIFDVEYQLQPFLYTVWKSGLADRQNLALTVLYSMLFAMGATPLFSETLNQQGQGPAFDFASVPARVTVPYGAGFAPIANKGIIDPALMDAWKLAEQKIQESTIYAQTLGEPLGGNAAYSMVALLHQAGRLPLVTPQRKASLAIAEAVKMAYAWWKAEGSDYQYTGALGEVEPNMIPDYLELEASLDIALPQDQYQQAQIGGMLAGGQDPLLSKDYVRENILHINQPAQEQRRIWGEQAANLYAQKFFIDQATVIQQKQQAFMQPQPQPGQMPPGMEGQMPPEMMEEPEMMGQPPMMTGQSPEQMGMMQPAMPAAPGQGLQQGPMMPDQIPPELMRGM